MEAQGVFIHSSYKDVMKAHLRGANRGTLSRAAEALNCQRSYLSRVMNSEVQLTPDQAYKLALFFQFTTSEREYFQALVDFERAGDPAYRAHLETRLRDMKRAHESLAERSQRPQATSTHDITYFSSWLWTAIHFLTSIPSYQTRESIARRLGVPVKLVAQHLETLEAWGFVKRVEDRWEYVGGEFHLKKDSPLVVLLHQNWRQRAVLDAQLREEESLHFTNVHTVAAKDVPRLKELMLKFISESNELMRNSPPEDMVVLLCDLFKV